MNKTIRAHVIVWPLENGLSGVGRPVEIEGREVGIAKDWADVEQMLADAGMDPDTEVAWRGGGPEDWE